MPKFLAQSKELILLDIKPGKPDPYQLYDPSAIEDTRDRVKLSPQKGNASWFYALKILYDLESEPEISVDQKLDTVLDLIDLLLMEYQVSKDNSRLAEIKNYIKELVNSSLSQSMFGY